MKNFLLLPFLLIAHLSWAQCGDTTHTTTTEDTWTSCQMAENPNSSRGMGHWIKYDLGYIYNIESFHIWNANQSEETDRGFRQVVIDYSLDGQQWQELGQYELGEASGYQSYTGEPVDGFDPIQARYVIITAETNWGDGSCYGLSEVKFNLGEVTGTQLVQESSRLGLYPNPTTGLVNLDLGDLQPANLRVVDLNGRIMLELTKDIPNQLNLSNLPAGLYFVSVRDIQGNYFSGGLVKE